ncbi:MAG: hypothetical protein BGN89_19105 [Alphaproteobacteria bacterium 64-6]|nr:MAG: hypothetical protein BGN89_19105 [Alphaproteobacteria bacterium 64-6]
MLSKWIAVLVSLGTLAWPAALAAAGTPTEIAGEIRSEVDGRTVRFPSLKTDITADVQGDLAAVTVVQTFVNPTLTPLNATYLFPLNEEAAVHAMQMQIGDEIVAARIERKEAARQTFETAQRKGNAAALLEQHRPNMFTQSVANLMPGMPIIVTLKYVQTVPRVDGAYQLKIPLVVGPRYEPRPRTNVVAATETQQIDAPRPPAETAGVWSFGPIPSYPPVNGLTAPGEIDEDRVALRINLAAGVAIPQVSSATHGISSTGDANATSRTVTLARGRTIDNRDFVLLYTLAGKTVQAGMLAHRDSNGGTFSLMLEPPQIIADSDITPREIVFLLDTSGSMHGAPIDASKLFMKHALEALRPSDYFRIIRFSNNATELATSAIPANPDNLRRGLSYVNSLTADGGTEVVAGLTKAFDMPVITGARRILVFLSDGYVGNEAEILRLVAANIGQTRTYVFGIGSAVNHYLLNEMARVGRGFARVVDPTEKGGDAAIAFARKLEATVMTDVTIDWGDVKVSEVTPATIPDLFAGDSIRVQGRFSASGSHTIRVTGKINGRTATLPLVVELPAGPTGATTGAIPLVWARSQIADSMRELIVPVHLRHSRQSNAQIEHRVTDLGLAHSLATQWTSFVAVSQQIVNAEPASARDSQVNLPMVHGVGPGAYGVPRPQPAVRHVSAPRHSPTRTTGIGFGGTAAPEPEALGGLAAVLLMLVGALLRRRQLASASPH